MKKIIGISAIFFIGLSFCTIAQTKKPNLKKESQLEGLYKDSLKIGPGDSIKIFIPDLESKLNFPDLDSQYFNFNPESETQVHTNLEDIYRMPIQKPEGNYPMPFYVPDSTINYTLRIKVFK